MKTMQILGAIAISSLAACANGPAPVSQGIGLGSGISDTYVGRVAASGPACPELDFHVTMNGPNELAGVIFSPQRPDVMSHISGTRAADGTITMQIAGMNARSPSGSATARVDGGHLMFTMIGGNCPMANLPLEPVRMTIGNSG